MKKFADRKKITFPLLSDAGSKTITAYGLLNKEAAGKKIEGVPYPGTMLVDQSGVIRGKLFLKGFVERHSSADLIKAAEAMKQP